jgi:NCAIR mutase (PurE)-related protein
MKNKENNIIGTRASESMFNEIKSIFPEAIYYNQARIISIKKKKTRLSESTIAIITAGTSDIPVAEEAAVTAELLGNRVTRIYDTGVAGIHRLVDKLPEIRKCKVVIVIAGMEGALASVVSGLVDKPVIAVPTSVGYGANFGGISALLAMLTSCSSGVTVVNIDNGFGAGFSASMINKMK